MQLPEREVRSLIVEDDAIAALIIRQFLHPLGQCDVVSTGEEALALFQGALQQRNPYGLVALDYMMPGLDGKQVLDKIRGMESEAGVNHGADARVILMSALDHADDISGFTSGDHTFFIPKPVSRSSIMEVIKRFGLIP